MEPVSGNHRLPVENLPDAFAYHQVITDDAGNPEDYVFLEVNRAFEKMFDLPKNAVMGKKITEVFPNIKALPFDWIGTFGKVALSGESMRFEHYYKPRDRWYEITAYRDAPGFFAIIFRDITGRRRAEEALKETHKKLETVIRDVPDIIYQLDPEGQIVFVSDAVRDYGYTPEEMLGTSMLDYVHPEDREKAACRINERRTGERRTRAFQIRLIPKEAKPRYFEVKYGEVLAEPVFLLEAEGLYTSEEISSTNFAGTHGVIRDISEQKLAEIAIKDQNNLLEGIIDGVTDVLAIQNPDHTIQRYNRAGYRLLNMTQEQVQHKKCYELLGRERQCNACPTAKALQTKKMEQKEKYIPELGLYLDCCSNPILDEAGNVVQIILQLKDITDRKQAEKALQESEERFRYLAESLPLPLAVIDEQGHYEYINPPFTEVFGYTHADVPTGKAWLDLAYPDPLYRREVMEVWINDLKTHDSKQRIFTVTCKDGTSKEILFRPVLMDNGKRLLTCEDITERKQAEEQIKEKNAILTSLNNIALKQAAVRSYESLVELLTEQLQESTGAIVSVFNEYDATQKMLITRRVRSAEKVIKIAVGIGGKTILKTKTPVDDVVHHRILSFVINYHDTLTQASEGTIPAAVSAVIQKLSGIERFITLSHVTEGELYGTSLIGLEKGQVDPPLEFLESFAHISAISLRRLQAEQQSRESENKYRFLVEGSFDAITIVNKEGRFTDCNQRALKLFGVQNKDEFAKYTPADLSPKHQPDGRSSIQALFAYINQAIAEGFSRFEWIHQHKNGENFPTEVILVSYQSGEDIFVHANVRDISDRKQAEQKLADYTLELEQLYNHLNAEMDKARQVHERTLPTALPTVEGISFAAHYQPAQKMGGDLYDVIHKDNKLIFYLSDVSGHGLDGAMLSVFVKQTIKSYISFTSTDNFSPPAILHHLAEQFSREDYPEDLYVCVFIAVLDLGSMELSYSGAGFQEPLLVQLGNGERLKLKSKGMFITSYLPLDILKFQEDRITLTSGSTIFCNTDGLTEQGSEVVYYKDRLPDVFFQNTHLSVHLLAQAVVDDFAKFNDGSLQGNDDITFLVLQVNE